MKSFAIAAAALAALGLSASARAAIIPFTASTFTLNHSTMEDQNQGDLPVINSPSMLTMTNEGASDANSVYYNTPVSVASPFTVSFTYQAVNPSYGPPTYYTYGADGITVTLAAVSDGEANIGGRGAGLGWGNNDSGGNRSNNFIPNSAAVEITDDYLDGGGVGFNTGVVSAGATGGSAGNYVNTVGMDFTDPTLVSISYDGTSISETMTDTVTNNVYSLPPVAVDLSSIVGSDAYLAFTAGSGGYSSTQTISDLSYSSSVPEPASIGLLAIGGALLVRRRNRKA